VATTEGEPSFVRIGGSFSFVPSSQYMTIDRENVIDDNIRESAGTTLHCIVQIVIIRSLLHVVYAHGVC
jgi:hypothetical protein